MRAVLFHDMLTREHIQLFALFMVKQGSAKLKKFLKLITLLITILITVSITISVTIFITILITIFITKYSQTF